MHEIPLENLVWLFQPGYYYQAVIPWFFPGLRSCLSSLSTVCLSSSASPPRGPSTTQTGLRPPDSWSIATERPPVDCDNQQNVINTQATKTHTEYTHASCTHKLLNGIVPLAFEPSEIHQEKLDSSQPHLSTLTD